jgi:hypothetical protein
MPLMILPGCGTIEVMPRHKARNGSLLLKETAAGWYSEFYLGSSR